MTDPKKNQKQQETGEKERAIVNDTVKRVKPDVPDNEVASGVQEHIKVPVVEEQQTPKHHQYHHPFSPVSSSSSSNSSAASSSPPDEIRVFKATSVSPMLMRFCPLERRVKRIKDSRIKLQPGQNYLFQGKNIPVKTDLPVVEAPIHFGRSLEDNESDHRVIFQVTKVHTSPKNDSWRLFEGDCLNDNGHIILAGKDGDMKFVMTSTTSSPALKVHNKDRIIIWDIPWVLKTGGKYDDQYQFVLDDKDSYYVEPSLEVPDGVEF